MKIAECMWEKEGGRLHTARTHSPLGVWDTADTAVWPIFSFSGAPGRTGPPKPAITDFYHRINPVRGRRVRSFQKTKKLWDRAGWVARNLPHSLTGSLLRRNVPSHRLLRLRAAEECFSFLTQIRGAAGVKGEAVWHPQPAAGTHGSEGWESDGNQWVHMSSSLCSEKELWSKLLTF